VRWAPLSRSNCTRSSTTFETGLGSPAPPGEGEAQRHIGGPLARPPLHAGHAVPQQLRTTTRPAVENDHRDNDNQRTITCGPNRGNPSPTRYLCARRLPHCQEASAWMRPALAAHPGKSQGPPPSKHGLEVHRPKRRARLRSPLQESPVPGDPLVRRRTGKSCRVKIFMPRVAAAPELGATRRPLREAKRQPLTENCDVRPRDCVPMHGHVGARSRSTAQQTATTAVGLELGSDDGLDGTIGFDGQRSCDPPNRHDRNAYRSSWLLPRPPPGEGFALPAPRVEGLSWTSPSRRW
jgi:hypothetical protein